MKVEKEVKVLNSKLWFFPFPFLPFCLSSIPPFLPSLPPSFFVAFLSFLKLINSVSSQTHVQFKITTINLSTSWKNSENFEISPLTPCYHQAKTPSQRSCVLCNLNYPCTPEAGVKSMLKIQCEQSHSSSAYLYPALWRENLFFEVVATHETKSLIEMKGGEKRWEVLCWWSITWALRN